MSDKWIISKAIWPHDDDSIKEYEYFANDYYNHYYDLIKSLDIKSVFEIGVRAGFSAYAMLSANPNMKYVGIDNDAWWHGYIHYARYLLTRYFEKSDWTIIEDDSQSFTFEPWVKYDLCHIDGDHSTIGCLKDLLKLGDHCRYMFVDDYDFISDVRKAVDIYLDITKKKHEYMKTFRGHMLILC